MPTYNPLALLNLLGETMLQLLAFTNNHLELILLVQLLLIGIADYLSGSKNPISVFAPVILLRRRLLPRPQDPVGGRFWDGGLTKVETMDSANENADGPGADGSTWMAEPRQMSYDWTTWFGAGIDVLICAWLVYALLSEWIF